MIETRRLSRRHSVPDPPAPVTCRDVATVGICIRGPGGADRGDQRGLVTVVVGDQVVGLQPDRMHGEEGCPRGGEDALGDGPVGAGEDGEVDPRAAT